MTQLKLFFGQTLMLRLNLVDEVVYKAAQFNMKFLFLSFRVLALVLVFFRNRGEFKNLFKLDLNSGVVLWLIKL